MNPLFPYRIESFSKSKKRKHADFAHDPRMIEAIHEAMDEIKKLGPDAPMRTSLGNIEDKILWARISQAAKEIQPWCSICGSKGDDDIPENNAIALYMKQHSLHADHIVPKSRGGKSTPDNIQILCERCNESKAAKQ
jgi:HNH endonuclease